MPMGSPIPAMGNVVVRYNDVDITAACNSAQLAAAVEALETTNLASTAIEKEAGPATWSISCEGPWSKELDDVCGPDVVTPPATKRNADITVGKTAGSKVKYAWTAKAFIENYSIDASSPNETVGWSGDLNLSGAPARTIV